MYFAEKIIQFNQNIQYTGSLPPGIGILNPFRDNPHALLVSTAFYRKYYADEQPRRLILGINPGRFGAGLTGIPFTDPKRLESVCGIPFPGDKAHEPSSVFVYEVIEAYGGPEAFYRNWYINSVCPLGFVRLTDKGELNYNYYDSRALSESVHPFILENMRAQKALGILTDVCICFGTGQNFKFLEKINAEHHFFKKIIPLEHPRFVMQYKAKHKQFYIEKYLEALSRAFTI